MSSRIHELYDDEIPFFSKEIIRDAIDQLERLDEGSQKVSLKGIDNIMVHFDVATGRVMPAGKPQLEHVLYVHWYHACQKDLINERQKISFHRILPSAEDQIGFPIFIKEAGPVFPTNPLLFTYLPSRGCAQQIYPKTR